jgi:hypothetical protein
MASCATCGTTVLFGGKKHGTLRFCNDRCESQGTLVMVSRQVPHDLVEEASADVHGGACPRCRGPGPVDVHSSHWVYSVVIFTKFWSEPQVSCRGCGVKKKLVATLTSALIGWWGFPFGLLGTPVQLGRNLIGLFLAPNPARPSEQLQNKVRLNIAAATMQEHGYEV